MLTLFAVFQSPERRFFYFYLVHRSYGADEVRCFNLLNGDFSISTRQDEEGRQRQTAGFQSPERRFFYFYALRRPAMGMCWSVSIS